MKIWDFMRHPVRYLVLLFSPARNIAHPIAKLEALRDLALKQGQNGTMSLAFRKFGISHWDLKSKSLSQLLEKVLPGFLDSQRPGQDKS